MKPSYGAVHNKIQHSPQLQTVPPQWPHQPEKILHTMEHKPMLYSPLAAQDRATPVNVAPGIKGLRKTPELKHIKTT